MIFANEAQSHKALVTTMFPVPFERPHSPHAHLHRRATPYTKCDFNDIVGAALLMASEVAPFVWNTVGPIPQYTTFQSQVSGPALLFFSGSATGALPVPVGVEVVIGGKPVAISQYQPARRRVTRRFRHGSRRYSAVFKGIRFRSASARTAATSRAIQTTITSSC